MGAEGGASGMLALYWVSQNFFCWGLHAGNLPRLGPKLKQPGWLKEKL